MSEQFSFLTAKIQALWACTEFEDVCALIADVATGYGYDVVVVACVGQGVRPESKLAPFWTNADPKWVQAYIDNAYYNTDPAFEMASRTTRPFTWDDAYFGASPDIQKQREHARSFGLSHCWTLPIHTPGQVAGLIGFASAERVVLGEIEQIILSVIARIAYEKFFTFFVHEVPDSELRLTDRERAILMLVARGKTNWEAGAVLSISEYSVRDHLKRLSKKFQTSNRTHTVARAMQLGLIVP